MPLFLRSLLFSLLILAATACTKKKEPEPTPQLEGTWTVQYTETTFFNADGVVLVHSPSAPPVEPTTYLFTPSDYTVTVGSRPYLYTYTREQTIIHSQYAAGGIGSKLDLLIKTLTQSELLLEYSYSAGAGYNRIVIHLAR
ncbi:hypothetical protein [Hymenobacter jeollabukensis]|uniref:Lipocalin-like domain-containing protein n=1 Tax=Hymenobacter jeollabukensis TaxID=2025313 RepID=A0A5R8WSI6_9BACT|nr:hypothetical protein [Hymenobacter jeollabukensis]TLM94122.1 hypothetical protein FDY95_08870 [Hymenobacter jeollabukensis]